MNSAKIKNHLFMFLIGLTDAVSLYWVQKILFVTHPVTKKIHPSSLQLLSTLKNTFIQVFVFLIGLPYLCRYLGQDILAVILSTFFLLLTYGYLFFYNTAVITSTKNVALWASKFPNTYFCQFDKREKAQLFYSLSNQVKSFIFLLLYYTPILLLCMILMAYIPRIGTLLLLISESFFNAAFYFLKKWPYDRFNAGFIETNLFYMLGFGFLVSFVCNVCLDGEFSKGAYFIISQWMIINCLLFSPPEKQINSLKQAFQYIRKIEDRSKLQNSYNKHRKRIRIDKQYRDNLINNIRILRPALKITQILNNLLAKKLGTSLNFETGTEKILETTVQSNISSTTSKIGSHGSENKNLEVVSQIYSVEDAEDN